ncbi:mobile element protein [Micromonospora craniellae]|uniref:Mobile element protein n=1 Tax=Micromonospora craniellae TaxID=2294034 RepID=A0A372G1U3_9ACTN|nr:mobile element protein [Micromonospora craniellae]QOC89876.1 mobile element protein [Micromonospora craniellae]RFS47021.1 mobile element protein [Micromonospora craniellae]
MTAPAEPVPYLASPQTLSRLLGVPVDDQRMLDALAAASGRFRGQVHHSVHLVEGDEVWLDGDGSTELFLPAAPVLARPQVWVDDRELDPSEFEWSRKGILRRRAGWPDRLNCVRVLYDHGYAQIPADVQEVVIDQARVIHEITPGVQTVQAGGESVTYGVTASTGVTAQWSIAVEAYRVGKGDQA